MQTKLKIEQLVINWHLTEACNYRCHYCYATWHKPNGHELIRNSAMTFGLLSQIAAFFQPDNVANPLTQHMTWRSVRLNLAGGEPLLYARCLPDLIASARRLGLDISLISNASLLNDEMLASLAPGLSWLGISIDSTRPEANREIGRIDRHGRLLDLDALGDGVQHIRRQFPSLGIKLNTVVNALNHEEDFTTCLQRFSPEKWKVLRMLPMVNQRLAVSNQQYEAFITRHAHLSSILTAEDTRDMCESYLMIDPAGRFFQNGVQRIGQGYLYSRPIIEVGAAAAFTDISFIPERFASRYGRRI